MADPAFFAALDTLVAQVNGLIHPGDPRGLLLYPLLASADPEVGVMVAATTPAIVGTVVYRATPRFLSLLQYADVPALQTAMNAPGFVHPDDAAVVADHVSIGLGARYVIRLKRANGTYLEVIANGINFRFGPPLVDLRISTIRRRM